MGKAASKCFFLFLLSLLTICANGTLLGFSYDARRNTASSSLTKTVSFLKQNVASSSQIRVFVADHKVLSSLSHTGVSVDLYLNNSLFENLVYSNFSAISWLKSHVMTLLQHKSIKSIIFSSDNGYSEQNAFPVLLSTLKLMHSALDNYGMDNEIKVSVAFSLSVLKNLNRDQERHLNLIFDFIRRARSFILIETGMDGELSMGDHYVLSMIKRATLVASVLPRNDVPMVLTIKSNVIPSAVEIAEFTDKVSKSIANNSKIDSRITALYAEVSSLKDFAQKELEWEKEQIFPASRRELMTTTLYDTVNSPTAIFPTTPISATPVITAPDTSTPTIVTVPATNPVTITPTNPAYTPLPFPSTTPITAPSTDPSNTPVPITNPVTTPMPNPVGAQPVTNPVTTYPAPTSNVPVTTPVTNPLAPPATTNAPAVPGQSWCVAKNGAMEAALQQALDYACGIGGADCSQIQQGGSCYNPDSLQNHASYAFNSYYQKNPASTSCDFGGTATIVSTNASTGSCIFPSSASSSSLSPSTTTPITTPATTPTTTPATTPTTSSSSSSAAAPPPPIETGVSGSGTPPSVLNDSNPAAGTPTVFGSESPPVVNNSASVSTGLQPPLVGCVILVTSFVTGKIILDA